MQGNTVHVVERHIQQLGDAHVYSHRIVTQVVPLKAFYPAEAYHQHFVDKNPTYPYVMYNDLPKLRELKKNFPAMCKR